MTNATESHAAATIADAHGIWPPPTIPAPDVVDVDYGTMNRELLAEKLASAYWCGPMSIPGSVGQGKAAGWLRVVDVAIAELQGTS